MKKVFVILLSVVFLTAMAACDGTPAPAPAPEPQVEETTPPCDEQAADVEEEGAEEVQEQEEGQE